MKKKPDEKTLGGQINVRWEMKKGGRDRSMTVRDRGPDQGRGREGEEEVKEAREGGESVLSLIIIGLTVGDGVVLLLGGTCVFWGLGGGVWSKCRGHRRDGAYKISRLLLYHLNCTALN